MDLLHIIGYAGALGSLVFGLNQLRIILVKHGAKDVSMLDYAIRVAYSTCLGIYAAGKADIPFAIVGFGGAIVAVAVVAAGMFMKERNGGEEHGAKDKPTAGAPNGERATGSPLSATSHEDRTDGTAAA